MSHDQNRFYALPHPERTIAESRNPPPTRLNRTDLSALQSCFVAHQPQGVLLELWVHGDFQQLERTAFGKILSVDITSSQMNPISAKPLLH